MAPKSNSFFCKRFLEAVCMLTHLWHGSDWSMMIWIGEWICTGHTWCLWVKSSADCINKNVLANDDSPPVAVIWSFCNTHRGCVCNLWALGVWVSSVWARLGNFHVEISPIRRDHLEEFSIIYWDWEINVAIRLWSHIMADRESQDWCDLEQDPLQSRCWWWWSWGLRLD